MARFWVYRLRSEDQLVIDLQSSLLDDLPSRVVAPLYPASELSWLMSRLTPRFIVNGELYVMATQRLGSVPLTEIGPAIGDLSHKSDEIIAATDFLFQGF